MCSLHFFNYSLHNYYIEDILRKNWLRYIINISICDDFSTEIQIFLYIGIGNLGNTLRYVRPEQHTGLLWLIKQPTLFFL